MCGRYVLTNISGLVARFGLLSSAEPDEAPRYNLAPPQPVITVVVAGEEARELPTHVRLQGGGLFAFAGLYTRAPDGRDTCAIVTTVANEAIAPFHARMPVILESG